MANYSYEFKKQVIMEYLSGEGGRISLAKKHGIASPGKIIQWVKSYREFGDEGIRRSRKQKKYSFEYKLRMVELYLTSELSYQELALQEGMNNPTLISKWVCLFRAAGPGALRPQKKGRKKTMKTPKPESENPETPERIIDTSAEHVKELEAELLNLRIENAFLKELRRLRLEEEALLKKQRESSTASEENSN